MPFSLWVPAPTNLRRAVERSKVIILGLNTPRGERDGEFGLAAMPGRQEELGIVFGKALEYIAAVGGSAVHCLAGKVESE